ncbi:hypothetical protein H4Q26_017811 [Puccinia striiformis f. sp. tritici PST-130]|nr:hypothetical protein H4Q26_017811 [Puccinia striiformis f. sp. tritici PST-130]
MSSRNTGIVGYGGTRRSYRSVTCNTGALKEAKLPSSELSNSNTYRRSTEQISIPQASSSTTIGIRLFLKRPSSLGTSEESKALNASRQSCGWVTLVHLQVVRPKEL